MRRRARLAVRAVVLAAAALALAARADDRVDTRGGGTVIVAVATGTHVLDRVADPGLYRANVQAYFEGTIDAPFCRALLTDFAKHDAFRDGKIVFLRSCVPVPEAASFAVTTDDGSGANGVRLAARAYFDLSGVAGPRVAPGRAAPRPDGCLALRFAIVVRSTLRPARLAYDATGWSIEGGFPQPGCADGGAFPSGDVSDDYAAYVGGPGFRAVADGALREAGFDATVPIEESLLAYAPLVERLRARYRTRTIEVREGAIVYRFSNDGPPPAPPRSRATHPSRS